MTAQTTTQSVPQNQPKAANSFHMIRALGGVGILCSLLIVSVFQFTKPIIEKKKAIALERAIYKVVPGASAQLTFEIKDAGTFTKVEGKSINPNRVFAALDDQGNLKGFAIEAAGNGFQDVIKLIYGYSHETQTIIGIQVLESKETPGLGDKIEKDEHFLANFVALDVQLNDQDQVANPIELVKPGKKTDAWQIDSITGATISSSAVSRILKQSSETWMPRIQGQLQQIEEQLK